MMFRLDCEGKLSVELVMFENVTNAKQLISKLREGKLDASFVKSSMVFSTYPLLLATLHAIEKEKTKSMITRSIGTEVLYNLSPSRNISTALNQFGIQTDTTHIVAIMINPTKDKLNTIREAVNGHEVSDLETAIKNQTDHVKLKQVYDISEKEQRCSSVEDSILTRMACKQIK